MISPFEQCNISLWFVSPESCPPNPGMATCCYFRLYYFATSAFEFKIGALISMKRTECFWDINLFKNIIDFIPRGIEHLVKSFSDQRRSFEVGMYLVRKKFCFINKE